MGGRFWDAFVTKLTAAGALSYSTYLGANGIDEGHGIAVDSSGAAYVGGLTTSTNFLLQSPIQGSSKGGHDAFVAKINPTLTGANVTFTRSAGTGATAFPHERTI